jgi:hypothetical protein
MSWRIAHFYSRGRTGIFHGIMVRSTILAPDLPQFRNQFDESYLLDKDEVIDGFSIRVCSRCSCISYELRTAYSTGMRAA